MKWSIRLGRLSGIEVRLHVTFLLLLGFLGLVNGLRTGTLAGAFSAIAFLSLLFGCVLLHEFGHALAARRYGIGTSDITLLPIGGVARLERMPEKTAQELVVALAGPLVNVAIAVVLALWMLVGGTLSAGNPLAAEGGSLAARLLSANVFLVMFNLLPAFPMDGGRVLRALLAMRMPHARATGIAAGVGQAMALVFGFLGLLGNPMLLFIALFVWIGAAEEASAAEMKSSLRGFTVRDAMLTEFRTITAGQSLGDAVRLLLAGSQHDFPVVAEGQVVGLLRRSDLLAGVRDAGEASRVDAHMIRELDHTAPHESLEQAFQRVRPEKGATLPVLEHGLLVGLLTAENVGEFVMIRGALAHGRGTGGPPPLLPGRVAGHGGGVS